MLLENRVSGGVPVILIQFDKRTRAWTSRKSRTNKYRPAPRALPLSLEAKKNSKFEVSMYTDSRDGNSSENFLPRGVEE